jgi:nitroreductase
MDFFDVIKMRRSIRAYAAAAIPRKDLERIIDAARFAPTARGEEPWEFVVVTDRKLLKSIAGAADHGRFIASAAACVCVYCRETKYYLEDGCAATENILLQAAALGIGSCWVAGDKKEYASKVSELLGVPAGFKLVSLCALGYPLKASDLAEKNKRSLIDLLHWERF